MLRKIGHHDYEKAGRIDDIGLGRLAKVYSKTIEKQANEDHTQEFNVSVPHLEVLKKKIAEKLNADFEDVSGHLPVTSVFDALQIIRGKKNASKNIGLRALAAYLHNIWKKDRTANLSANTFLNLKDHYIRNYPKSGLADVFDEMADSGYFTLPLSDLMQIAAQIETQEDFDQLMQEHGLNGMHPHQVKARKFIVATLTGDSQ